MAEDMPDTALDSGSTRSAVGKIVAVLEHLAAARKAQSVADLGAALGLSRAQAHRIVASLTAEGLLCRHPKTGRLLFGPRLGRMALRIAAGSPLQALWHGVLQDLVDKIGETCNIVVVRDGALTYFDRVEVQWPLSLHFKPGSRVPLHCTASGKAYLMQLPARERRMLLSTLPLDPFTPHTVTDRDAMDAHLAELAREDIGIDIEEFVAGMVAIAVPIRSADGQFLAALAVHAPTARLPAEELRGLLPALRRAAQRLGDLFDGRPLDQHAEPGGGG